MSNRTAFYRDLAFEATIDKLQAETRKALELTLDAFMHSEVTFEYVIDELTNAAKNAVRKVEV